jgi:hypothetical protein
METEVHYRLNYSPPPVPILRHMHPVYTLSNYFPKIQYNVIILYTSMSSECSLPFGFSNQNTECIYSLKNCWKQKFCAEESNVLQETEGKRKFRQHLHRHTSCFYKTSATWKVHTEMKTSSSQMSYHTQHHKYINCQRVDKDWNCTRLWTAPTRLPTSTDLSKALSSTVVENLKVDQLIKKSHAFYRTRSFFQVTSSVLFIRIKFWMYSSYPRPPHAPPILFPLIWSPQ